MDENQHSTHHRRSIRLQDYDYTQNGAYFVTICTHERTCLFGSVNDDGEMVTNEYGKIAWEEWFRTSERRPYVELDSFVVMPNHVHGIIVITTPHIPQSPSVGAKHALPLQEPQIARFGKPVSGSLGAIVGAYKSAVTKRIKERRGVPSQIIWQRNYHEHIIRNETKLHKLREYVQYNPMGWVADRYNPQNDHP